MICSLLLALLFYAGHASSRLHSLPIRLKKYAASAIVSASMLVCPIAPAYCDDTIALTLKSIQENQVAEQRASLEVVVSHMNVQLWML